MTQAELLNSLYKEHNLKPEDVHTQFSKAGKKQYTIIARTGIEKLQAANDIRVHFELIQISQGFAVKAYGHVGPDGDIVETFGSATTGNCKNAYMVEMAEKRALSRVVLKIIGLYKHGVMGEDEITDDSHAEVVN